jgi:hypothetical protein
MASAQLTTAGSSCQSICSRAAASRACARFSAITTATASPTWRARSGESGRCGGSAIGLPSAEWISQPQGRLPTPSVIMSEPLKTATTPGAARAALASMRPMRACASGERTICAQSSPGLRRSST